MSINKIWNTSRTSEQVALSNILTYLNSRTFRNIGVIPVTRQTIRFQDVKEGEVTLAHTVILLMAVRSALSRKLGNQERLVIATTGDNKEVVRERLSYNIQEAKHHIEEVNKSIDALVNYARGRE